MHRNLAKMLGEENYNPKETEAETAGAMDTDGFGTVVKSSLC